MIKGTKDPDSYTADIKKLLHTYATARGMPIVYCEECGARTNEGFFQRNVCREGDFDLCPGCYGEGIRCYDSEHSMVRRITRNDRIVEVS